MDKAYPSLNKNHSRWRRFAKARDGAVAVEFGLLAPIFFFLVGAMLETALMFLSSQVLDSAVQDASRLIRTGQAQKAHYTLAQFRSAVCGRTFGLFGNCSGIHFQVSPVTNFASASNTMPVNKTCSKNCTWTKSEQWTPGQGSQTVMVQAYYKWPIILTWGSLNVSNLGDGTRLMASSTVFRNEPFT